MAQSKKTDPVAPDSSCKAPAADSDLVADRRAKLSKLRDELGIDPYGGRVDGLEPLAQARNRYDEQADQDAKADPGNDQRPIVKVAGRIVLHRDIGRLIFLTIRDATGDLQIGVSKKAVDPSSFKLAKLADLGDVIVAQGRLGSTKTGEITVWAAGDSGGGSGEPPDSPTAFFIATKSLAPPPSKWHGLQDPELRYRKRYVDLYTNPQVMQTFLKRSAILSKTRMFLTDPPGDLGPGFIEVETPMMQPIAGGAAARPFVTHHNALDIDLFLRVAPELYLKRLLVGGMPRVFEINRNFRNEGIDYSHNPEFTMLELYQAFGDYHSMMALTETLINTLANEVAGGANLPFKDHEINYSLPFRRATYHGLFLEHNGFDPQAKSGHGQLINKAKQLDIDPQGKDHDVLLNQVWEQTVEDKLIQPTFVMDYPASLCPLTKTKADDPTIAERFELIVAGMELANAYTELNDPDVQDANFRHQLLGQEDDDSMAKMDHDFIEALQVGMPPAGGLGVGIDRLAMLLTNSRSIRDVILFPLMRPKAIIGDDPVPPVNNSQHSVDDQADQPSSGGD